MKMASYIATHDGYKGIANRMIRWRFGGSFFKDDGTASHCEVVFEPGDNVDEYMPDGTTQPDADGAVWCASASAMDPMPAWSPTRAGRIGGVRFKRIVLDKDKWEVQEYKRDPVYAAKYFRKYAGQAYDWGLIFGFLFWVVMFFVNRKARKACSSACAGAGGYEREDFYHPELLRTMLHPQPSEVV